MMQHEPDASARPSLTRRVRGCCRIAHGYIAIHWGPGRMILPLPRLPYKIITTGGTPDARRALPTGSGTRRVTHRPRGLPFWTSLCLGRRYIHIDRNERPNRGADTRQRETAAGRAALPPFGGSDDGLCHLHA